MTESLEMYLETISLLHDRMRIARVTDIARELGVSKPSVHAALHELERRGLIQHEHYGEVFLSAEGRSASQAIRRRHDLLTAFLRETVGVTPEIAEQDACRIEHYLSEETMSRIAVLAGDSPAGDSAKPPDVPS
jgi:DtxR family Mn-dependent transcriptional regulator